MPKFRRRARDVNAVQWFPDPEFASFAENGTYINRKVGYGAHGEEYLITEVGLRTPRGFIRLKPGDWIVTEDGGLTYVVETEMFTELYEPTL